jgi:hypothetical protein
MAILLLAGCGREAPESGVSDSGIAMDGDDIAGVVQSASGPEAGVWVIAETDDFATRYARIVVTDCPMPAISSGCAATACRIPRK